MSSLYTKDKAKFSALMLVLWVFFKIHTHLMFITAFFFSFLYILLFLMIVLLGYSIQTCMMLILVNKMYKLY